MPKQVMFENRTQVSLLDKQPGQQFMLTVIEDDVPEDPYWRRRANEGAIAPVLSTDAAAKEPAKGKGKGQ